MGSAKSFLTEPLFDKANLHGAIGLLVDSSVCDPAPVSPEKPNEAPGV